MDMGSSEIITKPNEKKKTPANSGEPRSSISDLVTWMISGTDKDANTQHDAFVRMLDSPSTEGFEFHPGSLKLTHSQTLQRCKVPNALLKHVQGGRGSGSGVRVTYSDKHKLAYVMLPKSGSSTARHMLKTAFHATEGRKSLQHISFEKGGDMEGYEVLTFIRDPLKRFYSQYDEAYVRTAPWQKSENDYYIDPDTKRQLKSHPFPYLFDNIHSYRDYEDVFCKRKNRKDCIFGETQEDGTLTTRFERFVSEYDGRDPFDVHLTLQTPMLSSEDGAPLHITQIYNTTDSEGGWKRISKQFHGENTTLGQKDGDVIAGRSYPRRFNSDLVSVNTQRRICELVLLDYCCLNLPLPEVCRGKHYHQSSDDGSKRELFCVFSPRDGIQPGILPST